MSVLETKRILREIKFLRAFNHENIVKLKDILNPIPRAYFKELYMVFELMESDLHQILASGQELTPEHIQVFMYQLLCGVKVKREVGK